MYCFVLDCFTVKFYSNTFFKIKVVPIIIFIFYNMRIYYYINFFFFFLRLRRLRRRRTRRRRTTQPDETVFHLHIRFYFSIISKFGLKIIKKIMHYYKILTRNSPIRNGAFFFINLRPNFVFLLTNLYYQINLFFIFILRDKATPIADDDEWTGPDWIR